MTTTINLGNRELNNKSKPYLIAEIGVNHEGSLEKAKELIELAKRGGADAVKFQSYKANKIASKNSPAYWDLNNEPTRSQYDLFKKYDNFSDSDYLTLYNYCKTIEIDFISTPFDLEAVEFLSPLMPFFKIASADITNVPLIRKIAIQNKPIVLSTGASTLSEISTAIKTINTVGPADIILLHCILNYPTSTFNANLGMIESLKKSYPKYLVGYSDHTTPDKMMLTLLFSHLLGAVVIEKHFTNDKSLPGNDHYHSMDVDDLIEFKKNVEYLYELIGDFEIKQPIKTEMISRDNARRSIVLTKDLKEGHKIIDDDLICKRPGSGISPLFIDDLIGMELQTNLKCDDILQWQHFKKE